MKLDSLIKALKRAKDHADDIELKAELANVIARIEDEGVTD